MKASIIVRSFNEEKYIGKLFEGISKQKTSFSYEIILVDSGSTDNTLQIASKFDVQVIHISPKDFTFGYSLNQGIEKSRGEVCVMISAHCYPYDENWLSQLVTPFKDEKVGIVYGKQIGTDETAYSEHRIFKRWFPDYDIDNSELAFCNNANSAIRKKLWYEYKFDEALTGLEDLDWAKHIKKLGYHISYKSSAVIFHIHDQSISQVFNRYYREAFAYKEIYSHEYFGFFDFLKFFIMNLAGDYIHSIKEGVFFKNIISIPVFRFLQFWGTYRAHQYKISIHGGMKRRLYYPDKPNFTSTHKEVITSPENEELNREIVKNTYIDITKLVDEDTPVWPGAPAFKRESVQNFEEGNHMDSIFSMNVHCGTHMDAPLHFFKEGISVDDIAIEKFFGKALVVEYTENSLISAEFINNIVIPNSVKKVLFKTSNSVVNDTRFNESFIALSEEAAKALAEKNIDLVGVDGPSIQSFYAKSNDTHLHLLSKEIIIVENLDLSRVESGLYNLTVLPLKIKGLEGSPVRAVLEKNIELSGNL